MRLLAVELMGFKSFARKTVFDLHHNLTAVIGPNGSGKSNLAEAIRWVLGEQSLKQLRGQEGTDVIFAGNPSRARAGVAAVRLTFDNESGWLPVDAPEVTLGRRVTRDGEGEYMLNGDVVRLLDVQQLLAEGGIGAKSYTVISQGMVDRYVTATPALRRELFDEATGVKALQLKMKRAQQKLAQATREAEQLRVVLVELEPRLRVLKRQVARHDLRQRLEQELGTAQREWFHHQWHERAGAMQQARAASEEVQERTSTARAARARFESELWQTVQVRPDSTAGGEQAGLRQALQHAEQEFAEAQQRYERQQRERRELTESLAAIRATRVRAEAELAPARVLHSEENFLTGVRSLLTRCRRLLQQWQQGERVEEGQLHDVARELDETIVYLNEEDNRVNVARRTLQHLEGPLQALARAQALEQERASRLSALPELRPPAQDMVQQLRAQLASGQATEPAAARAVVEEQLAQARAAEVGAEREAGMVQAVLEQSQRDVAGLEAAIRRECGSTVFDEIQQTLPSEQSAVREEQVRELAARVGAMGEVDPLALKEYEEVAARYDRLHAQLQDIAVSCANVTKMVHSLRAKIHSQFREQFATIATAFTRYFVSLFDGGQARLMLVDVAASGDEAEGVEPELTQGVEIMVHPPGKKLQHVQLLSGGEKVLTALALLFAILDVQRPPFLVLDEVDAALDEANSHRFATLLKEKSESTQCVVISHNRETMASAEVLYGITMQQDGVSKAYSVKMADITETEVGEEMSV